MGNDWKRNFYKGLACLLGSGIVSLWTTGAMARSDQLPTAQWWQAQVEKQLQRANHRKFKGCLFGDSISSALGNNLGKSTFNFAMGGLSSVSLLAQLKLLNRATVQCQKVVIAIGTNDAWYEISNAQFKKNLAQIITVARSMKADEITLIPAFYSTTAASFNPGIAGSVRQVDEMSDIIRQVAIDEEVALVGAELEPLFEDRSLRKELTSDGVHLNQKGKRIYRSLIVNLLNGKSISSK